MVHKMEVQCRLQAELNFSLLQTVCFLLWYVLFLSLQTNNYAVIQLPTALGIASIHEDFSKGSSKAMCKARSMKFVQPLPPPISKSFNFF